MGDGRLLTLRLGDGRDLEVMLAGPDSDTTLVFHNGTPMAAVEYPFIVSPAAERGLRTITFSRPGYATSTPQPGRAVSDVTADTEAVLEAVGGDRFVTVGWSGGGPHALACAALLPGQCMGAAIVAGLAPYGVSGLDWFAGMATDNVAEFGAALEGEPALTRFLGPKAIARARITGEQIATELGGLASDVDRAALTGEFAEILAESDRRAVSTGIAGWRDDELSFMKPWGFEVADIRAPAAIWHGDEDRMVPIDHGRWLSANVRGAHSRLLPGEGHMSLLRHMDRILDDVLKLASVRP